MKFKFLHSQVDGAPLSLFRIGLGILMACEGFGAILTGWVADNFVHSQFTFTFIGFEFLNILCGPQAYGLFFILGVFGLMVAVGYRYKLAIIGYTLFWAAAYFGQKTSYNNHYYLLLLLCILMSITPAHHFASFDVRRNAVIKREAVSNGYILQFKLLLLIVYVYAAIAKLYPDWLDGSAVSNMLINKSGMPLIGPLTDEPFFIYTLAIGGILFDFLIIPALWFRPTRFIAFIISIGFHIFNSVVFHIGIFPYLMLVSSVLFFEAVDMRRIFFHKNVQFEPVIVHERVPNWKIYAWLGFFSLMILLPLRQYIWPGNVHWTEEGHRLSWHMMLRMKSGTARFRVYNEHGELLKVHMPEREIWDKHARKIATRPDFTWQYAQRLAEEYKKMGIAHVAVYADVYTSLNGRPSKKMIDDKVNLAAESWSMLHHHAWITESPDL